MLAGARPFRFGISQRNRLNSSGSVRRLKQHPLEEFHPERMSSRILGQGDFQTLLEKAEEVFTEDQAKELERKLVENKGLDFNDFLTQLEQLKNMGPLDQLMDLMPFKNQLPVKRPYTRREPFANSKSDHSINDA